MRALRRAPAGEAAPLQSLRAARLKQTSPAFSPGFSFMRMRGLEPPRPYGHTDLNRARLPIPPHPRAAAIVARRGRPRIRPRRVGRGLAADADRRRAALDRAR